MASNETNRTDRTNAPDANPDPITGAPGSHPVGTGVGAAGGGAAGALAGAAIGSVVPGVGTVAGGVIGAVVGSIGGGLAGKGVAEAVNPTAEDAFWREEYRNRPYYETGSSYEDYAPAYRYGWESRDKHAGKTFEEAESDLRSGWERTKEGAKMTWDKARHATRDAWDRFGTSSSPRSTATPPPLPSTATTSSGPSVAPRTGDNSLLDESTHPVGTAVGAGAGGVGGAAAGAALGTAVFPGVGTAIGGVAGAVTGAVVGGVAGQAAAEAVNPTEEDNYWRMNYTSRPYYSSMYTYDDDYAPAYRYGWESYTRHRGRRFDDAETDLRSDWERFKGKSRLTWEKAKDATRDAWHRVERALPGDFDRDGR